MSELEHEGDLAGDQGFLRRSFAAQVTPGDGRTVDVRIVPFGEEAIAADGGGGVPKGVPYREAFQRGAFAHQTNAANRVLANFEHETGIAGVVGHGSQLREAADALYGSFRIHETPDGDKALMLVQEGVLDGVSLEFAPLKSVRSRAGVVTRVKAHLDSIALTRKPAYESARVLALREEIMLDEELLPIGPADETLERMKRLGLKLPERYVLTREEEQEVEDLLKRAFTEVAWDGSESRWDTAEAYCSAAVIDLNAAGEAKTKANCYLPIKEPGSGDVNVNAVRNALARIGAGDPKAASQAKRDAARVKLERLLTTFNKGN